MNRKTMAAIALATLPLVGCSTQLNSGEKAIIAEDYIMFPTDPKLLGCQDPETSEIYHSKKAYKYPARQISWDATGDPGSERGAYVVVSGRDAPAEMKVPVVVTMDLTENCDKMMDFHRNFGTKYSGWTPEGWVELLNYVIGQPLQNTLTSISQGYTWREIWNDEKVRVEYQAALTKELPKVSKARTDGQEFFTNFQVTVLKPEPVDQALKDAINREQSAVAEARGAEAAARAREATARAETAVAVEEANQRRAAIAGYPDVEAYLRAECIKNGCNPYQPTYVVPQGG